ncbi:MAG: Ig-like domain-containing protein [Clostridia bacterium]|nr:Ig-like domain-containing protein [Clostridia bacterium]
MKVISSIKKLTAIALLIVVLVVGLATTSFAAKSGDSGNEGTTSSGGYLLTTPSHVNIRGGTSKNVITKAVGTPIKYGSSAELSFSGSSITAAKVSATTSASIAIGIRQSPGLVRSISVTIYPEGVDMPAGNDAPSTPPPPYIIMKPTTVQVHEGELSGSIQGVLKNATGSLSWSIGDSSVASIKTSGGTTKVQGIKEGTTTLTCRLNNYKGDPVKATCTVKVLKKEEEEEQIIEVQSVSLPTYKDMVVGTTATLVATVSPSNATDKTVEWRSSNSDIVSVSNGRLTAKKTGYAGISAIANNGKMATCTVFVKEENLAVEEVESVSIGGPTEVEKGKRISLTATVLPTTVANRSVTWESSDPSIARVSFTGMVQAYEKGTVTITATSKADTTKKASHTVKVTDSGTNFYISPSSLTLDLDGKKEVSSSSWGLVDKNGHELNKGNFTFTISGSDRSKIFLQGGSSIVAKGEGSVTLVATPKASSSYSGTASMSITVKNGDVPEGEVLSRSYEFYAGARNHGISSTRIKDTGDTTAYIWDPSSAMGSKGEVKLQNLTAGAVTNIKGYYKDDAKDGSYKKGQLRYSINVKVYTVSGKDIVAKPGQTLSISDVASFSPMPSANEISKYWKIGLSKGSAGSTVKLDDKEVGKFTIHIYFNGASVATSTVTVDDGNVRATKLEFSPKSATVIFTNDEVFDNQIVPYDLGNLKVTPQNANVDISYSASNGNVEILDGLVYGVKEGQATVTATDSISGLSAKVTLTVEELKQSYAVASALTKKFGETITLEEVLISGNPEGLTIKGPKTLVTNNGTSIICNKWPKDKEDKESLTAVINLYKNGKIVKNSKGNALATTVTILRDETKLSKLEFKPNSATVIFTNDEVFDNQIVPYDLGNLVITPETAVVDISYSASNGNVEILDGLVYGVKEGSATVTAKDSISGKTAKVSLTVKELKESYSMVASLTKKYGETISLSEVLASGSSEGLTIKGPVEFCTNNGTSISLNKWPKDKEDKDKLTAVVNLYKNGSIVKNSKGNALKTVVTIERAEKRAKKLEFSPKSATVIFTNDEVFDNQIVPYSLSNLKVTPEDADVDISYSASNGNVEILDGLVYGVKEGSATVTATDSISGKTAKVSLTVKELKESYSMVGSLSKKFGETISLSEVLASGSSEGLTIKGPVDYCTNNGTSITCNKWPKDKEDKDKVTVTINLYKNGKIVKNSKGNALSTLVTITSDETKLKKLEFSPKSATVTFTNDEAFDNQNDPYSLSNLKITPEGAKVDISYSLSNGNAQIIDGLVYGVKEGSVTLTAKDKISGKTATASLTVKELKQKLAMVSALTVTFGDTITVGDVLASGNDDGLTIRGPVDFVTNSGGSVICNKWPEDKKAKSTLTAVINLYKNGSIVKNSKGNALKTTVTIKSDKNKATKIAFSPKSATIRFSKDESFEADWTVYDLSNLKITPENADVDITYSLSNGNAEIIDGLVYGKKAGSVTVTATDKISGHQSTATLTVKELKG